MIIWSLQSVRIKTRSRAASWDQSSSTAPNSELMSSVIIIGLCIKATSPQFIVCIIIIIIDTVCPSFHSCHHIMIQSHHNIKSYIPSNFKQNISFHKVFWCVNVAQYADKTDRPSSSADRDVDITVRLRAHFETQKLFGQLVAQIKLVIAQIAQIAECVVLINSPWITIVRVAHVPLRTCSATVE